MRVIVLLVLLVGCSTSTEPVAWPAGEREYCERPENEDKALCIALKK